jgi:hypothetical protein
MFRESVSRLSATPGLAALSVASILAEIGVDMSPFPSAAHLISSAGQRRECGQAPLNPAAARRALAQDPAGPGRLVRGADQEQLLPGAVSAAEDPPGSQEGHCGGGAGDPHGGVRHAQARGGLPRPRPPTTSSAPSPPAWPLASPDGSMSSDSM